MISTITEDFERSGPIHVATILKSECGEDPLVFLDGDAAFGLGLRSTT